MKHKKIQRERQTDQSMTIFSSIPNLPTIEQMVDCLIDEALLRTNNLTEASRILGISSQNLCKRINSPLICT